MRSYPIHLNYDQESSPIGMVEILDEGLEKEIRDGAIVPYLRMEHPEGEFKVISFGLVKRTEVDITPNEFS